MRDYNRNNRDGDRGGRRFGGRDSGRRSFGARNSDRREMYHARCAQCGKDCEVPFRPSEDRPVYCSSCFEQRRNEDGNFRESGRRNFGRPNFEGGNTRGDSGQITEQLKNLNVKLDKILRFLEPKIEAADLSLQPKIAKIKTPKKKKEKAIIPPSEIPEEIKSI